MKINRTKKYSAMLILLPVLAVALTGCGRNEDTHTPEEGMVNSMSAEEAVSMEISEGSVSDDPAGNEIGAVPDETMRTTELEVCFGDDGEPFMLHLYDNDTAAAIARHVGTADWRLPIYHYDDYDNWEFMQYYDIPSRYEIPSNAEMVILAKGGEVYYSEPNRIVLFYHDAEISSEYTKVGYFDYTEEFVAAVENNPVLEGWGNKIVLIQSNE